MPMDLYSDFQVIGSSFNLKLRLMSVVNLLFVKKIAVRLDFFLLFSSFLTRPKFYPDNFEV